MIRFDMSEYQERHSLSRMIGAPPGYVGHDAGGQLTESLRRRPFSILLFDEVEKAAKEVLTVLLQLMDDGRITDGQGRIVDAKNCIVVMTSNLGAEYPRPPQRTRTARSTHTTRELVMNALRNYFLPEFLNRISSIVIFNRLTKREIRKIVDLRLSEIQKRLEHNDRNVHIDCSDEVKDYLGCRWLLARLRCPSLASPHREGGPQPSRCSHPSRQYQDGENARVVMRDGRIEVLPNHELGESSDSDDDMMDSDDLAAEMETDMPDLYDD